MAKKTKQLHPTVKECLGYQADEDDADVLADWKHRSTQVCKPCWELKYCPYGPFVEQSPLLPVLRDNSVAHIERLKRIVDTGILGDVTPLTDERREHLEGLLAASKAEPNLFAIFVARKFYREKQIAQTLTEGKEMRDAFAPPLGPIEHYQVPAPLDFTAPPR